MHPTAAGDETPKRARTRRTRGAEPPNEDGAQGAEADRDRLLVGVWSMYNWADHAWATPVAAVLIGPWMLALAKHAVGSDSATLISLGPVHLRAEGYPSAMIAVAAILQLLILPFIGAHVDRWRSKRKWLAGACATGAVVCALLALTGGGEWLPAGLLFLAGSLIEGISDLTWQGMLPELGVSEGLDRISARGQAIGYLGGGCVLAVDLALVSFRHALGLSESVAVRACFLIACAWWAGFGLPAIRRLRPIPRARVTASAGSWADLRVGIRTIRKMPQTFRYLVAYFCFSDAMSAVIALASTFLTHQLFHDNATKASTFLFSLILMIQFIAMGASAVCGRLSRRFGPKRVLIASLVAWCVAIIYSYAILTDEAEAVVAGVIIGVGLGITTPLARSLFSRMVPAGQEALFFSVYEITSQGTAWVAPLIFTVVVDATGSFRQAILSLIILFIAGLSVLTFTDVAEAEQEATRINARNGTVLPSE